MDEEQVKSEFERCIRLSVPGPHVFLLVVRLGQFTQEEKSAVEWIQRHFGEEASQYTMVLFTGADQIKRKSVAEFLSPSKELQDLLDSCGRRYHAFNNEDKQNLTQVSELLQKIEKMVNDNGGQHYTNEMYQEAEKRIREEEKRQRGSIEKAGATTGKMNNLRVVLVGKTGAGKSSSGNTILGTVEFEVDESAAAVTMLSSRQCAEIAGKQVSVIDTPGFCSTSLDEEQVGNEIKRCVRLSVPGPHVFLLVIRLGRFTQEEKSAVEWIQRHFGEEASQYTMVLFTGADQIKRKSVEEFLNRSKEIQDLLDTCGRRYHVFNNEDTQNLTQVSELLQKIEEMVKGNGGQHYTNEMYQEAERSIREEERRKRREEILENTKKYLKGAAIGAVAVGAIVGAGAVAVANPEVASLVTVLAEQLLSRMGI
ncbi:hypothetical protein SKAU_G00295700 [Synaphobranchus kaupii]|uniref:AIG1-type G domain-containing protein n=1 Tax=Synaphobranchus kaupii TaxID=118154 RepID=A0A9Q1EUL9_SYNKA|nr:hypothetical protein SKAU_G00295700 [Synaphobranchus kaupii]